jgi:dihydrofolate synthase/folylpolyglutamate synthase
MTYQEALAYWFGLINYEQRAPRADDLKLDRMRLLLRSLGNPQDRLRIIHVAGSKGKGSTSAMLAGILMRSGYRTGLFTSPHLCRIEERLQIDGRPIYPEELAALVTEIRQIVDGNGFEPPTFFELVTAVGFLHFVRRRVEAAILEVGLGGRFDSTNVCLPEVALITSISLDHVQQLGDRLDGIAMEKAGIVKPGVPAISGATPPSARTMIEAICRQRGAPLQQIGRDFTYQYAPARVERNGAVDGVLPATVQISTRRRAWPALSLGLLGEHQAANAAVALAAIERLQARGWHIPDSAVAEGLAQVDWPARLEIVGRQPLVVLDCAHNVASVLALVETMRTSFPPGRRFLIFASSSDKDVPGMLRVLGPHYERVLLTRYTSSARGVEPERLAALLEGVGGPPHSVHTTAAQAWEAACTAARPEDQIYITGSVFLAGELRPVIMSPGPRHGESPTRPFSPPARTCGLGERGEREH